MNKTLLLILCDFLLLNLLALTRWEKAEPASAKQPPVPEMSANAATKDRDLVDTMKKSLEDERQKQSLAAYEKSQVEARQRIEGLSVAVKVAEQEKQLLRDTAETLKTQVVAERQERIKVQEATTQLAQGVGQLAEKSGALT